MIKRKTVKSKASRVHPSHAAHHAYHWSLVGSFHHGMRFGASLSTAAIRLSCSKTCCVAQGCEKAYHATRLIDIRSRTYCPRPRTMPAIPSALQAQWLASASREPPLAKPERQHSAGGYGLECRPWAKFQTSFHRVHQSKGT